MPTPDMDPRMGMPGNLQLPPPPAVETEKQAAGLTGLLSRARGPEKEAGAVASPVTLIVDLIEKTLTKASDGEPSFKPFADAAIALLRRGAEAIALPVAKSSVPSALEASKREDLKGSPPPAEAPGAPPIGATGLP